MIRISLEREAISSNDKIYGINKVGSRHAYKKEKTQLKNTLLAMLGKGSEEERTAWKIVRHWGKGKRQFDDANLIGGFKILIDCIVELGHIQDDNPEYFKGYYFQKRSKTGKGSIELIQLNPRGEIKTALEKMAETYQIDQTTLVKLALETGLIREEKEK